MFRTLVNESYMESLNNLNLRSPLSKTCIKYTQKNASTLKGYTSKTFITYQGQHPSLLLVQKDNIFHVIVSVTKVQMQIHSSGYQVQII